jgi:hypothetical protein
MQLSKVMLRAHLEVAVIVFLGASRFRLLVSQKALLKRWVLPRI